MEYYTAAGGVEADDGDGGIMAFVVGSISADSVSIGIIERIERTDITGIGDQIPVRIDEVISSGTDIGYVTNPVSVAIDRTEWVEGTAVASIDDPITVGIALTGVVYPVAVTIIACQVAFIGNSVGVAIGAGSIGDIRFIGNSVLVAILSRRGTRDAAGGTEDIGWRVDSAGSSPIDRQHSIGGEQVITDFVRRAGIDDQIPGYLKEVCGKNEVGGWRTR